VFGDDRYGGQITLVTWLALNPSTHGVIRRSGIYFNPEANYPLPREVELILEGLFDRTKVLQKELERIVEKIKRVYSPERIILFGSLAQDRVKEGSDIDLAIVKDTDKRPLDRCLEIANICQPSVAVNFIVYTPEEIKRAEKSGNFFVVEEILKKGQVLYER
jgi:predicted nucleotidyltransferase